MEPTETQLLSKIDRIKARLKELDSLPQTAEVRMEQRNLNIRWVETNGKHYALYGNW